MASIATALGLRASLPGLPIPTRVPSYLIFHFIFAYGILASRTLKQYLGIDNQAMPRQDIANTGEAAVKSGKISRAQLDMVKRNDAAHYNSIENYTLLVAALLSAQRAGVENRVINRTALVYTLARFGYAAVYVFVADNVYSQLRGVMWWIGNSSCLYLLWLAGKKEA